MATKNSVFIAASLDGFMANSKEEIDWLHSIPNPAGDDMGYGQFIAGIDAIVMGRITFETTCGFDIDWPYSQKVFVLSHSLKKPPEKLKDKVEILKGEVEDILSSIHQKGYYTLYIDGGKTIPLFLKADQVDELILITIPVFFG